MFIIGILIMITYELIYNLVISFSRNKHYKTISVCKKTFYVRNIFAWLPLIAYLFIFLFCWFFCEFDAIFSSFFLLFFSLPLAILSSLHERHYDKASEPLSFYFS